MAATPERDVIERAGDATARNLRIRRAFTSAAASRLINVAIRFVQIPVALAYLGEERYGVWVTLFAFLTMATFADLGISNGLINELSESFASDDRRRSSAAVANALLMTGTLAVVFVVVLLALSSVVSWRDIVNSGDDAVPSIVAVLGVMFVVSVPLQVHRKALVGFQRNDLLHRSEIIVAVGTLGLLIAAVQLDAPAAVVVAFLAAPRLVTPAVDAWLLRRRFPWLEFSMSGIDRQMMKKLARNGSLFVSLSIGAAIAFQSDFVVLSQLLGPEAATLYSVPLQIYMFIPLLAAQALLALWPAYGEAAASGDTGWVLRAWRRSTIGITLISTVLAVALFFSSPFIVRVWTNANLQPDTGMRVALGLWIVVFGAARATHTLLNGLNVIGFQAITSLIMAVANLIISIALVHWVGPEGVAYGSAIAMLAFVLVPQLVYLFVRRETLLGRVEAGAFPVAADETP